MSTTFTVSTADELAAALGKVGSGDTILLAGGDYGRLFMHSSTAFGADFTSSVTIAAADPNNPPVFSELDLRGTSNLTFAGVTFDYTFKAGDPISIRPFQVSYGSANIAFEGCTFDGDVAQGVSAVDDGFGYGISLSIRDTTGARVEDCEISGFHRGLVVSSSDDVEILRNDIHSIRMDGMNFAAVQGVLIEGNHIHDFIRSYDSGDHADMIQFWTAGTTRPSTDIVIRDNLLDIGAGGWTQSIFMRNEVVDRGQAGSEMFYQNITIENNVIVNAHHHGITIGETSGLTIRNNSVLHADGENADGADKQVEIPKINISSASTNVTITQNATAAISGYTDQFDWSVRLNAYVQDQDPLAPGWYGEVFVASSLDTTKGAHNFVALPGGMLDKLGAGATATLTPTEGAGPFFHIIGPQFSNHIQTFDAGIMGLQPTGTTYLWTFGDGTTASGATVTHAFASAGRYDVTLSVQTPEGRTSATTFPLAIASADILRLDSSGGFAVFADGMETVLAPSSAYSADGLQLGAPGVTASVARTHVMPLLGTTEATIAMTLKADAAGTTGEVVRLGSSFVISVNHAGEIELTAWSSTGQNVKFASTGIPVNDTAGHSIEVRLSDGQLELWVDGVTAAARAFDGTFADIDNHNLTFGNAWGKANFNGDLSAFSIRLDGDAGLASPETASQPDPVVMEPVVAEPEPEPAPAPEPTPDLLRLDDTGGFVVVAQGEETLLAPSDAYTADGLQLGAPGVTTSVARAHIVPLLGATEASIAMTLTADVAGTTGEVVRLGSSFVVTVVTNGSILVQASSSTGQNVRLASTGVTVNDTAPHDIALRLTGGQLEIWVDGGLAATEAFDGAFADSGNHDLHFGNAWGKANFNGDLSAFSMRLDANAGLVSAEAPPATEPVVEESAPLPAPEPMADEPAPDLLRLDDSGSFVIYADGEETVLAPSKTYTEDGLQLGAPGTAISVARSHLTPLFETTEARIIMTLEADVAGTAGEVARLHGAFVVTVANDGNILVQASSSAGQNVRLTTTGIKVNDADSHDIALRLADGQLELWVDGNRASSATFNGSFANTSSQDLIIGQTKGNKTGFNGDLSGFSIRLDADLEPEPIHQAPLAYDTGTTEILFQTWHAAPAGGYSYDEVNDTQDVFSYSLSLDASAPLM